MCIISHKHKFIFVRVRKTASTSMHVALSEFCGPLDIIAHIGDKDELESKGEQNNWSYLPSRKKVFYNHIPAFRIKEMIAEMHPNIWNSYFKFCFERNPFDKVISQYYFHHKRSNYAQGNFHEFVMHGTLPKFSDWRLYTDENRRKVIVDKVFKYEEMQDAFEYLENRLNLPKKIVMPEKRFKGWTRKEDRHYRNVITSIERKRIEEVFNKEIKEFGYEF
jgi:hypothetical protein